MSRIPDYVFKEAQNISPFKGLDVDYQKDTYEVSKNGKFLFVGNETQVLKFFDGLPVSFVQAIVDKGYSINRSPWNHM